MSSSRAKRPARALSGMEDIPFDLDNDDYNYVPSDGEDSEPVLPVRSRKRRKTITPSVKEVKEVLHAKEKEEQEEQKARKKQEIKAKREDDVANAKKEKSELEVRSSCLLTDHLSNQQQINYGYDFELYSSTSAKGTSERWFIYCESAKSKPEKIFVPKEKVPKDQLLYVKWNNLTKKERVQHGNSFRNYLNVEIPGFTSRRKIR
jgi:hypothetical protein